MPPDLRQFGSFEEGNIRPHTGQTFLSEVDIFNLQSKVFFCRRKLGYIRPLGII